MTSPYRWRGAGPWPTVGCALWALGPGRCCPAGHRLTGRTSAHQARRHRVAPTCRATWLRGAHTTTFRPFADCVTCGGPASTNPWSSTTRRNRSIQFTSSPYRRNRDKLRHRPWRPPDLACHPDMLGPTSVFSCSLACLRALAVRDECAGGLGERSTKSPDMACSGGRA